ETGCDLSAIFAMHLCGCGAPERVLLSLHGALPIDYFTATKNTFSILQSVIAYRKERELAPLLRLLDNYCPSQMANEIPKESVEMICDIRHYAMKSERFLSSLENSSESVFIRTFLRMI